MTQPLLRLRIFVSSPGDVGAERAVALAATERLQLEFRGQVELQAYLWERSVLRATDTFQAQIVDIQEVDLALFVLWSRVGTPLPVGQFARADGSQYRSGTEYEYERALEGFERAGRPEILCYLKTAEVRLSLKDRAERARRNAELDEVGEFVDTWFKNPDGTFKAAFYSFEKTAQFEELIEIHLRNWVRERLKAATGAAAGPALWLGSPFRGLQSFDFEHAHIYCGRTAMVAELLDAIRRRGAEGRGFLMVTGMSGVGKSSLVRAGLLPLLTRPSVIEGVIGWRRAIFRPNVSHQGLTESFAAALVAAEAVPDLGDPKRVERGLAEDPGGLARSIVEALDRETLRAREARPDPDSEGTVRLVILVDQFEEIFDETVPVADRDAFAEALRALVASGRIWILATLRADFFSRTADLPERFRDLFIDRGGLFTVGGPRPPEIAQMIRRPAEMAGLRFERRGDPEEGLDDVLRDAASGNATVLPLLEFTLDELWRRSAGSGLLRFSDYDQMGGLHGALRIRADEAFGRLKPNVQAALPQILAAFVHIDPTDDRRILQNRVPMAQFDRMPECRRLIEAFTDAHLFVGDVAADGTPVVALAHEALLREWPPAVRWIEGNREMLGLRAGISAAAALWRAGERREGRLLTGELLRDAVRLMRSNAAVLAGDERAFVAESQAADRRGYLSRLRRGAVAAAAVILAILAALVGPAQLSYGVTIAGALPRVWSDGQVLPVSPAIRDNLGRSIDALVSVLRKQAASPTLSPWSMAQVRTALHGLPGAEQDVGGKLRAYMTRLRDHGCHCWHESPLKPPNQLATAWVLSALAIHGQAATNEEIDSALARQAEGGWWSVIPTAAEHRNGSTAATALMLLALQRQLDRGLVEPGRQTAVAASIALGVKWLRARALPGTGRWQAYSPDTTHDSNDYAGTSALVLHVLRLLVDETAHDRPWIDALPEELPDLRAKEITKATLITADGYEIDDSRMLTFPWSLLATVNAALTVGVMQRARALVWVEQALRAPLAEADFGSDTWIIAEFVHVLREVEAALNGRASPVEGTGSRRLSPAGAGPSVERMPGALQNGRVTRSQ